MKSICKLSCFNNKGLLTPKGHPVVFKLGKSGRTLACLHCTVVLLVKGRTSTRGLSYTETGQNGAVVFYAQIVETFL